MTGRGLAVAAALIVLLLGVWLIARDEGEAPSAPAATGSLRGPPSDRGPSMGRDADPREDDAGAQVDEAPLGDPPPRGVEPAPGADGQRDEAASFTDSGDDDDSALDPADRADADRTLVFAPDADGIRGAVEESLPAIKDCYQSWLQARPDLSGRVGVRFVIEPGLDDPAFATISTVELVDSELGHVFMEGCVGSLFEELQFEAPTDGPINVTYPLRFTTEPEPTESVPAAP